MSFGRPRIGMVAEHPWSEEDAHRGGVMQTVLRLADGLARRDDIDFTVVSPSTRVSHISMRPLENGRIVFYPSPRHDLRFGFVPTLLQVRAIAREFRLDLLHAQALPHLILPTIWSRLPHVVTIHGIWRNELKVQRPRMELREGGQYVAYRCIESYYLARVRNVIATTDEIERMIRAKAAVSRVYRIDNAIDQYFFSLPDCGTGAVVLFVGWINNRKGVHVLLEAAERLADAIPDLEIRLVGATDLDPHYVAGVRRRFDRLFRTGSAKILGVLDQQSLYGEVSRCRVLCLPSLAESAPMVISQAMAAGKPVVATRVGGIPYLVEDGVTGRLCQSGDSYELAACLEQLIRNTEEARRFGENARSLARERHSIDRVTAKTVQVYRDVLKDRMPG